MTIKIPVYPDAWLAEAQLGPLYTDDALEAERIMKSPDSTPAERSVATEVYAGYESLQMQLSDGYADALSEVVLALAAAYSLGEVEVVIWTVDGDEPPGIDPTPPGVPAWATHQRVFGGLARGYTSVSYRGAWTVETPKGVVFEL